MKRFVMTIAFAALICSCGGGAATSGSKIEVKLAEKSVTVDVTASGTYKSVKTFTDVNGNVTRATSFYIVLANYDLDPSNMLTMKKPLTAPEQSRLALQLIGAEGTDQNSELKPGVYKADPKEKYMTVDSLVVSLFTDGKETNTSFETSFSASKITGQIEVTSVTEDEITGTIDITEGERSAKGPFTAKISKKK